MKRYLLFTLFFSCCLATALYAAELETIENVTLIEDDSNDGDSFKVRANGKELHLRLYYVDCLETTAGTDAELERIREQQYHFGLADPGDVVRFGKQATEYVKRVLSRPFTVHTGYAFAPGRSATGRYYAFIETHDGRDLGHLLVEQGLARIHGKTRPDPHDTPSETVLEELQDMRSMAMLNHAGIWEETDPRLLSDMHKRQREKDRERQVLRKKLNPKRTSCDKPIDLNVASTGQLKQLPGIGKVKAATIVAGKPYQSVDDLLKIPGIGEKTLAKIRPCLTVGN
ncbi:MAG: helix-hairpin-helix domain-containing protein [Nitrospira sp.]|nr:helix-hairpin-helix domain-containing protein [Nitrospira sp.]